MDIQMVGINYSKAEIDIRERFSFTKTEKIRAMEELIKNEEILGCVIIATCNRTELWISVMDGFLENLSELLCQCKQLSFSKYQEYLEVRKGEEAVKYLFYLTSGLKSQILGEDQILTQVKEAISLSRECFCTDQVLEVLFRMAVTAGKEVKTQIVLPSNNQSAPLAAICQLEREGYRFRGRKCLVIGNGIMGKLTAQLLMDRGADVTVTVRQYKSGIVDIPPNAKRIDYGKRYDYIPECDFVFSATASPNITIRREELEKNFRGTELVFVDLAVPRDVDTSIVKLPGMQLFDMDYFRIDTLSDETKEAIKQADVILEKRIQEYITWYESKDVVPVLLKLSENAAQDVLARLGKPIRKAAPENTEILTKPVEDAVKKVVAKLLFSIRDSVDPATFRECTQAMKELYQEK